MSIVRLFRAESGRSERGMASWTSSRAYAEWHALNFGASELVACEVDVSRADVLDLREEPRSTMLERGLVDLRDYGSEPMQDLLRALADVFRAHGFRWVAFREPDAPGDEWLQIGGTP